MNFKKLAEQKIDELSGKKTPAEVILNDDSVDLFLEGLDEELSNEQKSEENFDLNLDEDDIDLSNYDEIKSEPSVQNLFDGYLGEQSSVPNPLEYGPNATYRNLREGVVYKKGPDNLWEVFVKDGTPGRAGQSAPGGGCGVTEVTKIATDVSTKTINVVGSLVYTSATLPVVGDYVGQTITVVNAAVPSGLSKLNWNGTTWVPPHGELICAIYGLSGTPLVSAIPGTSGIIYTGNVIPDYMIPDGLTMFSLHDFSITNAAGSANSFYGITLAGAVPTEGTSNKYFQAGSITPGSGGQTSDQGLTKINSRRGANFIGPLGNNAVGSWRATTTKHSFVSGNTRVYVMANPSKVDDLFRLYSFTVWSAGNL